MADLLGGNARRISDVATQIAVDEHALYRLMRFLASNGVFQETSPRTFANTELSRFLRSDVPGSVRSFMAFRGSELFFAPFGEIIHSIQTGQPAREKMYGANVFDYLKTHPELAGAFDNGMTSLSQIVAPEIAKAYNFAAWGASWTSEAAMASYWQAFCVHIRQFVEFWPTYLMWSSGLPSEAFSAVICSFAATYNVVISSRRCRRAAART